MEVTARLLLGSLKLRSVYREASSSFYNILMVFFIGKGSCLGLLDNFGFEILA